MGLGDPATEPRGGSTIAARVWLFVVDAGRARQLECTKTEQGRVHVEERDVIENHTVEHEHARPSPRMGKGGNTYASEGHEGEAQLHRFAKEVVDWIEKKVQPLPAEKVVLFSAPRFLGELRKLYGPGLVRRIEEHQGDLTHLSPAGLARHPAVGALFEALEG